MTEYTLPKAQAEIRLGLCFTGAGYKNVTYQLHFRYKNATTNKYVTPS
jgi:hypothetical protein